MAQGSCIVCGNLPIKCLAYSDVALTPDQPGPPWEAIFEALAPIGEALWTHTAVTCCPDALWCLARALGNVLGNVWDERCSHKCFSSLGSKQEGLQAIARTNHALLRIRRASRQQLTLQWSSGSQRAGQVLLHMTGRGKTDNQELTLTPMNLSLRTIQDSKKTNDLLQQNRTETSVAFIFFIACKYR